MITCESCCREFEAKGRSRDCPHCGFNNGGGWWPRTKDVAGRRAAEQREKQHRKRQRTERKRPGRREVSDGA